jgi:hypothetical protein
MERLTSFAEVPYRILAVLVDALTGERVQEALFPYKLDSLAA